MNSNAFLELFEPVAEFRTFFTSPTASESFDLLGVLAADFTCVIRKEVRLTCLEVIAESGVSRANFHPEITP